MAKNEENAEQYYIYMQKWFPNNEFTHWKLTEKSNLSEWMRGSSNLLYAENTQTPSDDTHTANKNNNTGKHSYKWWITLGEED